MFGLLSNQKKYRFVGVQSYIFTYIFNEIGVHHWRAQSEHKTMAYNNETHGYEFQSVYAFQIVRSLREREQLAYVSRQRERLEDEMFSRFFYNSSL